MATARGCGLAALLLAAVCSHGATAWVADTGHSRLEFTATLSGGKFDGRFTTFAPDIVFDPADLAGSRFLVRIQTASADTADAVWKKDLWLYAAAGVAVLLLVLIVNRVTLRFWYMDTVGSDTYYSWVEGRRILRGQNPYERILHGSMEENNKYSTYFPLFYETSALVQRLRLRQYQEWIDFWRYIFLACNIAVGLLLGWVLFSRRTWALALLGMTFWYFEPLDVEFFCYSCPGFHPDPFYVAFPGILQEISQNLPAAL